MRLLFAFFLLLNVVYFYWQSQGGAGRGEPQVLVPLTLPSGVAPLTLLRERGLDRSAATPAASAARPTVSAAAPAPAKSAPAAEPVTVRKPAPPSTVNEQAALACFTIGPFAKAGTAEQARKRIAALDAGVEQREVSRRVPRGYWVYLPALKSYSAAKKKVEEMQAMGLGDLFIMGKGSRKNAISLGLFKSKRAASTRFEQVKAKGLKAVMETQYRVTKQRWLDVTLPEDRTGAIASLAELTEDYSGVNLSQRSCK